MSTQKTNQPMNDSAGTRGGKKRTALRVWIGRGMSGLVTTFLLFGSALPKLFVPNVAEPAMQRLGWDAKHLLTIASIEVAGAVLYAFPRTAVLGAVLLTGLLGGAVATHLRVDDPLLSHTLFPVWLGLLLWGGLWLRSRGSLKLGLAPRATGGEEPSTARDLG
jgi:DoxX-like family